MRPSGPTNSELIFKQGISYPTHAYAQLYVQNCRNRKGRISKRKMEEDEQKEVKEKEREETEEKVIKEDEQEKNTVEKKRTGKTG
jgi:hypothetical protein